MHESILPGWGATASRLTESQLYSGLSLARVITQERGQYTVVTESGELAAVLSGKLLYNTADITTLPSVGDWVLLAGDTDLGVIQHVLPRTSCIIRKAAGSPPRGQVIATNVDIVFICMALSDDFNLRRLERYLAVVWESGAAPVVVLTKADLAHDNDARLTEVNSVAISAEVITTSAWENAGMDLIRRHIGPGMTVAFIGSSGVGKSTLVNTLVGRDIIATSGLRNDGQGRHTTTHREAILLPGGGVLIDTPGMRELGLDAADIDRNFADIEALARECRFGDCTHVSEPGCAVQAAVAGGELDTARLASYRKLGAEAAYAGKTSRQIADEKTNRLFGGKSGLKAVRKRTKEREKIRG